MRKKLLPSTGFGVNRAHIIISFPMGLKTNDLRLLEDVRR